MSEIEKVEVVAYRYTASRSFGKSYQVWHYQEQFPEDGCRKVAEIGRIDELMTVAQHERIVEQYKKDAERYRYLRDNCIDPADDLGVAGQLYFGTFYNNGDHSLDSAIDTEKQKVASHN